MNTANISLYRYAHAHAVSSKNKHVHAHTHTPTNTCQWVPFTTNQSMPYMANAPPFYSVLIGPYLSRISQWLVRPSPVTFTFVHHELLKNPISHHYYHYVLFPFLLLLLTLVSSPPPSHTHTHQLSIPSSDCFFSYNSFS